jgi:hypothetical protein
MITGALFLYIVAACVIDAIQTKKCLSLGLPELNPFIKLAIPKFGLYGAICLNKLIPVTWLIIFYVFIPRYVPVLLGFFVVSYTYVLMNNQEKLKQLSH